MLFPPSNLFHCYRLIYSLFKTPKQVIFNPINIFVTFAHSITCFIIYFFRLTSIFLIYRYGSVHPGSSSSPLGFVPNTPDEMNSNNTPHPNYTSSSTSSTTSTSSTSTSKAKGLQEWCVQNLKNWNVVNCVTIIVCNYRWNSVCQSSFLFYCLLYNHSFKTNPNTVTNLSKLFQTTFAQCVAFWYIFSCLVYNLL